MQKKKESCEAETLSFARVKILRRMYRYKIWHFEGKVLYNFR